jgi:transcriptional regulator with XRE-family HTH domain
MNKQNNLATYRMSYALSQQELASLLGVRPEAVSRLERSERLINFRQALDLEAIFGFPPSAVFPDEFQERVEAVIKRATALDRAIRGRTDDASRRKRTLLARIIERVAPTTAA